MQYIALIHNNTDTTPSGEDWANFLDAAKSTGMFKGGSEIGLRQTIGEKTVPDTTKSVGGFMRFDSDNIEELRSLLKHHPVIEHGGTIELCEMPKT